MTEPIQEIPEASKTPAIPEESKEPVKDPYPEGTKIIVPAPKKKKIEPDGRSKPRTEKQLATKAKMLEGLARYKERKRIEKAEALVKQITDAKQAELDREEKLKEKIKETSPAVTVVVQKTRGRKLGTRLPKKEEKHETPKEETPPPPRHIEPPPIISPYMKKLLKRRGRL